MIALDEMKLGDGTLLVKADGFWCNRDGRPVRIDPWKLTSAGYVEGVAGATSVCLPLELVGATKEWAEQ
jgi:hypothetical protein